MIKNFLGTRICQRENNEAISFFIFTTTVKDAAQWIGIQRNHETDKGIQRPLKERRTKSVKRFFEVSPINTIPNSIIVAFNPEIATFKALDDLGLNQNTTLRFDNFLNSRQELGSLSFEFDETVLDKDKPALIVDGQHRLYGMIDCEENLLITIVALIDATPVEQAFQFVVINKQAKGVSTDCAKSILVDYNQEELEERLQEVRISYQDLSLVKIINDHPESPFYKLLDFDRNYREPDQNNDSLKVKVLAVEKCLKYIKITFKDSISSDDELIDFFFFVWNIVKNQYSGLWNQNRQFMSKVNLVVLNEFMIDKISSAWSLGFIADPLDNEKIEEILIEKTFELISDAFWSSNWGTIKDDQRFADLIKKDLDQIIRNSKQGEVWSNDLKTPKSLVTLQ